ncbi:MAG: o-succinylbenzoate synthase [Actinomycetota bacterium]|nr:o-succinylbenzoate synthase [Actinomycetota bacterium]
MPGPLRVVELIRVQMPLRTPFVTANDATSVKEALLVRVETDAAVGWGECPALASPEYSPETIDVSHAALRDELGPRALAGEAFAGPPFAHTALEAALLDASLRAEGISLAQHLGVSSTHVDAGVAIGIASDIVERAAAYVAAGYRRVKLKISPEIPLEYVRDVRAAVGADVAIQVDANESFRLSDADLLATLADWDVQCIEQPLRRDDIAKYVDLAALITTPICLDESIDSARAAREAILLGACSVVNVKPGRVGGLVEAVQVHDTCVHHGVDALVGGMLETGVGRAVNVALAALPGFTMIGDLSASDRYFDEDLTEPFVLEDGRLRVPDGPGTGVEPRAEMLERYTVTRERL